MVQSIVDLVINNKIELLKNYQTDYSQEYNRGLVYACLYGYFDIVKLMIEKLKEKQGIEHKRLKRLKRNVRRKMCKTKTKIDWRNALSFAALGSHISICKFLIDNIGNTFSSLDLDKVLIYAAYGGDIDIFNLIIDFGESYFCDKNMYYWNDVLRDAVLSGNIDIVKFIINKQNQLYICPLAMQCAATCGSLEIVQLFIENGYQNNWGYNYSLYRAAEGGNMEIINLFINKGVNDWDSGLSGAAEKGNMDLVQFFISKGATNWNWGLCEGAYSGNLDIVKLMICKIVNEKNYKGDFDEAIVMAAMNGHIDIIHFIISTFPISANGWRRCLDYASDDGCLEIVKLATANLSEIDFNSAAQDAIKSAARYGHTDIIEFFISKGFKVPNYDAFFFRDKMLKQMNKYKNELIKQISILCEDIISEILEYL